jgi:translocation and assembly module TamA
MGAPDRPGRGIVLVLLLAGCAGTGEAVAGTGPKVTAVELVGNRALPDGKVLGKLATRDRTGFLGLGTPERLDRAAVAQDVRRIEDIYEEAGYYDARARARLVPEDPRAREVTVRFEVDEGPRTVVRSLTVAGLDGLPAGLTGEVLDGAPLARGRQFTDGDYEALKEQLRARLRAAGYEEATVEGKVAVSPAEGAADVAVEVKPGPRYRIGEIRVVGNLLVPEDKIRGAIRPVLRTGEVYSPAKLLDAQGEVFSLGAFRAATVTTGPPDPDAGTVPVVVAVDEANFLRFRVGDGEGIDQNRQQARLLLDFTHLNLLGGLQRLRWENELAYRFLPNVVTPQVSGAAGRSELSLTQPDLLADRIDLTVEGGYRRDLTLAYRSQAVAGRLGFPVRFRRWLVFTPTYNLTRYFAVQIFNQDELIAGGGTRPTLLSTCPSGNCRLTLSYLEQRLAADRRDDPIEPRSGWFGALGLQEGGGLLGGGFGWVRIVPDLRLYVPLARAWVLATRLEVGWLEPIGGTASPIVVRFFGGGSAGFRGVGTDRLSPLFRAANGELVPLGGNSSLLASAELRWYFAETLSSAFFADVGDVQADPAGVFTDPAPQLAVGAGLRYRTPIGPVRFDGAYRVLRRPLVPVNATAPVEEAWYDYFAFFISIGEAF